VRTTFSAFILFCFCSPSFAWGPEGHRIVADIAANHLSPVARRAIVELLGDDDLAAVSTWADEIRNDRPETYGWHFVDISWDAQAFDEKRDCYQPDERSAATLADHDNCVVNRITFFENILENVRAPRNDRIEALKFIVHFVADVHQPLHAIAEARGGNHIHVVEFGSAQCGSRPCNLHAAWDVGLIHHSHMSQRIYVKHLERTLVPQERAAMINSTPAQWANESFHIAHHVWLQEGSELDEAYYSKNIRLVDEQLTRAGLRLAALLNRALKTYAARKM
jgi:hypothetical protein